MQNELRYVMGTAENASRIRGRVFTIVSDVSHLPTHRVEAAVKAKPIDRWAWICHNQDPPAEDHNQVVVEYTNPVKLQTVANAFHVPVECVWKWSGNDCFLRRCRYLTHEAPEQQALGKHMYSDAEVHASFPFREELKFLAVKEAEATSKTVKSKTNLRMAVRTGETLYRASMEPGAAHWAINDKTALAKLRLEYLATQELPTERINLYVESTEENSIARACLARLIARGFGEKYFPEIAPENLYYEIHSYEESRPVYLGYDGQPIIVWHDFDAAAFFRVFRSLEATLSYLSSIPTREHLAELERGLIPAINIFESSEKYDEFSRYLSSQHRQRRSRPCAADDTDLCNMLCDDIPILVQRVTDQMAEIMIRSGLFKAAGEPREYVQYVHYKSLHVSSFCRLNEDATLRQKHLPSLLDPVFSLADEAKEKMRTQTVANELTDDDFIAEILD